MAIAIIDTESCYRCYKMVSIMSQVRTALGINPYYDNEGLYRVANAKTDNEKTAVRMAKSRIMKDIIKIPERKKTPSKVEIKKEPENFTELVSVGFPPYKTLYQFQFEVFQVLEDNDIVLMVVPRDHGKSVLLTFYIEYLLDVKKMDVLLLGWSAKVFRMAIHAYTYFLRKNGITDEGIVKNTPNHFLTKDGIRFDCYGLKSKEVLGFHPEDYEEKNGLCIIVDDPMDESFEFYPAKERDLENRWESTIANINPTKLIVSGTRKFEGDFLEYFSKQYKDKVVVYHRTPYKEDGSLLCPERWTIEKLEDKRKEIGEYRFSSEYMGDPQPLTGGVWVENDIHWASTVKLWSKYDYCMISVDPSWTQNEGSDFTAIEVLLREKNTRKYFLFDDITGKFTFDDILEKICSLYTDFKNQYGGINIVVAIEKNGGGNILIDLAKSRFCNFHQNMIEVQHSRAKEERIMVLEVPIKNGSIEFLETNKDKELMREILTYPHGRKVDAIDSLAMAYTEMERISPKQFVIKRAKWY